LYSQVQELIFDLNNATEINAGQWSVPVSYLYSTEVFGIDFTMDFDEGAINLLDIGLTTQGSADNFVSAFSTSSTTEVSFTSYTLSSSNTTEPVFFIVFEGMIGIAPTPEQLGNIVAYINGTLVNATVTTTDCILTANFVITQSLDDLSVSLNPSVNTGDNNTITANTWNLGDASPIIMPTVGSPLTYIYDAPGIYDICYTATDENVPDCSFTVCETVTVYNCAINIEVINQYCDESNGLIVYELLINGGLPEADPDEMYNVELNITDYPGYDSGAVLNTNNIGVDEIVTLSVNADTPSETDLLLYVTDNGSCNANLLVTDNLVAFVGAADAPVQQRSIAPDDRCCIADACTATYLLRADAAIPTEVCIGDDFSCPCEPLIHPDYIQVWALTDVDGNILSTTSTTGTFSSNGLNEGTYHIYSYSQSQLNPPPTTVSFASTIAEVAANASGCFALSEPCEFTLIPSPSLSFSVSPAACVACPTGAIDLSVASGTPAYNYVWSTGATSEDIDFLLPNTYAVTVSDANNCSVVGSATVNSGILVSLRVLLEGPYDPSTGLMSSNLSEQALLPFQQPFGGSPWYYTGTEQLTSVSTAISDWVLIEIMDDLCNSVAQRAALLRNDGIVVDLDGTAGVVFNGLDATTNYYLAVRHRNHVAIRSATLLNFPNPLFDFTNPLNVHGTNQGAVLSAGTVGMRAGDFNADGVITVHDFNVYIPQIAAIYVYASGDASLDGNVTVIDFNLFTPNASHIGVGCVRY